MNRKRHHFIVLCTFSVFLLPLATSIAQHTYRDAIHSAKKAVVQVICSDLDTKGTGFIADKAGYVFTNHHVVSKYTFDGTNLKRSDYSTNIKVRLEDRTELPAKVAFTKSIVEDKRPLLFDYAILKLEGVTFTPVEFADYEATLEGSDIYFCGFPLSAEHLTTHRGFVSAKYSQPGTFKGTQQKVFQIDGSVNKGNSGGPLFDLSTHKVIGIVSTREGTISKDLDDLRTYIITQKANSGGGVFIQGVDPLPVIVELTNTLDRFISVGIGRAISTEYALTHLKELQGK
jgi:S1-C subfamily serine protease